MTPLVWLQRWPKVRFDAARVARRLAEVGVSEGAAHAADVALAAMCLAREPSALAALDEVMIAPAVRELVRRGHDPAMADEAAQVARLRLLLPGEQGGAAGLAGYRGEGPLASFVAVTVAHAGLRLAQSQPRVAPLPDSDVLPEAPRDPAKLEQRQAVRSALSQAMESLTPRQRAILRFHAMDGLAIEAIARIYFVQPATASRWLKQAHDALAQRLRSILPADVLEDLDLSQIDLSLSRVLGGA